MAGGGRGGDWTRRDINSASRASGRSQVRRGTGMGPGGGASAVILLVRNDLRLTGWPSSV